MTTKGNDVNSVPPFAETLERLVNLAGIDAVLGTLASLCEREGRQCESRGLGTDEDTAPHFAEAAARWGEVGASIGALAASPPVEALTEALRAIRPFYTGLHDECPGPPEDDEDDED